MIRACQEGGMVGVDAIQTVYGANAAAMATPVFDRPQNSMSLAQKQRQRARDLAVQALLTAVAGDIKRRAF